MPIDWGSRKTIFRLLAAAFAVIGKEGFKGNYGDIARLFGEPATYDAIQSQFREVSKMADSLRARQVGMQNRQGSVRAFRPVRRPPLPSPKIDPGDLEVVAEYRESSAPDGAFSIYRQQTSVEDPEFSAPGPSRSRTRTSPPPPLQPPSLKSSSERRNSHRCEEGVCARPVPITLDGMARPAKVIPEVVIILDQDEGSHYQILPSPPSADKATASFEAENTTLATSAAQASGTKESSTQSLLDHAKEKAQYRKLDTSGSQDTRAEWADKFLRQGSQEHATERARYRNLYFLDNGKDAAAVRQEISGPQYAASAHGQEEPKHETSAINAPVQDKVLDISKFFGRNTQNAVAMDDYDSLRSLTAPCKRNASPTAVEVPNRDLDTSVTPVASWMDHDTRKCLLCDGRRFPGDAFYKHENQSQRHRGNLGNKEKVVKAKARLERISSRRSLYSLPERKETTYVPQLQHREQHSQTRSNVFSPDQLGLGLSSLARRHESVAPRSKLPNSKQSVQHAAKSRALSLVMEEQLKRDHRTSIPSPLLKRKRPALELQGGEYSAQAKTKRAKADHQSRKARDDILVQISSADLDKLLHLHPDLFDKQWSGRATPAPSGWQPIEPSISSQLRVRTRNGAYPQQANTPKELPVDTGSALTRDSSEISRDYFQCSSRCDDSADSDYRDEEDGCGLEEEDDGDEEK